MSLADALSLDPLADAVWGLIGDLEAKWQGKSSLPAFAREEFETEGALAPQVEQLVRQHLIINIGLQTDPDPNSVCGLQRERNVHYLNQVLLKPYGKGSHSVQDLIESSSKPSDGDLAKPADADRIPDFHAARKKNLDSVNAEKLKEYLDKTTGLVVGYDQRREELLKQWQHEIDVKVNNELVIDNSWPDARVKAARGLFEQKYQQKLIEIQQAETQAVLQLLEGYKVPLTNAYENKLDQGDARAKQEQFDQLKAHLKKQTEEKHRQELDDAKNALQAGINELQRLESEWHRQAFAIHKQNDLIKSKDDKNTTKPANDTTQSQDNPKLSAGRKSSQGLEAGQYITANGKGTVQCTENGSFVSVPLSAKPEDVRLAAKDTISFYLDSRDKKAKRTGNPPSDTVFLSVSYNGPERNRGTDNELKAREALAIELYKEAYIQGKPKGINTIKFSRDSQISESTVAKCLAWRHEQEAAEVAKMKNEIDSTEQQIKDGIKDGITDQTTDPAAILAILENDRAKIREAMNSYKKTADNVIPGEQQLLTLKAAGSLAQTLLILHKQTDRALTNLNKAVETLHGGENKLSTAGLRALIDEEKALIEQVQKNHELQIEIEQKIWEHLDLDPNHPNLTQPEITPQQVEVMQSTFKHGAMQRAIQKEAIYRAEVTYTSHQQELTQHIAAPRSS